LNLHILLGNRISNPAQSPAKEARESLPFALYQVMRSGRRAFLGGQNLPHAANLAVSSMQYLTSVPYLGYRCSVPSLADFQSTAPSKAALLHRRTRQHIVDLPPQDFRLG